MADTAQPEGSPFWRFSLSFYREPAVAAACIDLQDQAGVDVNVLLFLLWSATLRRKLTQSAVEDLDRRIGAWRDATVIPLRALRRALKSPPPVVEVGAAEAFRTRIKAVELEAERLQQQTMFELSQTMRFEDAAAPIDAARDNLASYQAICARLWPDAAGATILTAFARLHGHPTDAARAKGAA